MKYFNSIDKMPMMNWIECQRGDLKFARIDYNEGTEAEDLIAWELLNYDHLMKFGMHRKHIRYVSLQKQLMIARMDYIITGDRFILNKIDDLLLEMRMQFPEEVSEVNYEKTFVILTKFMRVQVTAENTTVRRFFEMVELWNNEHKSNTNNDDK